MGVLQGLIPWGPGDNSRTAVWEHLKSRPEFEIDESIQNRLPITVAPDGYLKRILRVPFSCFPMDFRLVLNFRQSPRRFRCVPMKFTYPSKRNTFPMRPDRRPIQPSGNPLPGPRSPQMPAG